MFSLRSAKNRVVKSDLTVTYSVEKVDYTDSSTTPATTGSWYRVTRNASKSYSYVDMTQVGAMNCANDMVALYTRQCAILDKRASGDTVPDVLLVGQLQSSITPTRETGNVWRVDIRVSEEDVRASATLPADPASLFTAENARDYDEATGDIEITGQSYNTDSSVLSLAVSHEMTADERNNIVLLYKLSPSASDWSVRAVGNGLAWTSASVLAFTDNVSLVNNQSVVAIRYGGAMSNVVTFSYVPPTVTLTLTNVEESTSMGGGATVTASQISEIDTSSLMFEFSTDGTNYTLYAFPGAGCEWTVSGNTLYCSFYTGQELHLLVAAATYARVTTYTTGGDTVTSNAVTISHYS